ncbi:enterobactin transporter EntS [Micromonospora deserti]|uniref:Enterobactin transporter EntS n=1 Tax=Micromonospora deserti TaxID=2070366 RepID=A0A2W2CN23_9ACTN|nr:enterobactin transporter EntS [Micromonospora deserti]PZF89769.1 enterobactin transporter EntS [Micromonospora deserti]
MRLGQITMDLTPLRSSRDFRIMFWARVVALLGISLTLVALSIQVYQLTRSSLAVGMVNVAAGGTLLAGTLAGGVLADRYERRQLLLLSRGGAAVVFAALTVNALLDQPRLWVVYLCAAVIGVVDGVSETALVAIVPDLVPKAQLAAAGALTAITTQLATMVGPSVGGAIIAGPGVAVCYGITCVATVIQVAMMSLVTRRPPAEAEHQHPLRAIAEGLRFVRRNRLIAGLLLVDVCGGLFALPYAVFPEFGAKVLHGDPRTVGLMYSAPAVGAFLGALFSGWVGRYSRPGRALLGAGLLWGLGITALGASGNIGFALVFLGLAGAGMIFTDILVRALLQQHTPSALMGRVSSFWLALATVAPAAGGALVGGLAGVTGPGIAVLLSGLACVTAVLVIAAVIPDVRRAVPATSTGDGSDPVPELTGVREGDGR